MQVDNTLGAMYQISKMLGLNIRSYPGLARMFLLFRSPSFIVLKFG
jgi:hypothetical protein